MTDSQTTKGHTPNIPEIKLRLAQAVNEAVDDHEDDIAENPDERHDLADPECEVICQDVADLLESHDYLLNMIVLILPLAKGYVNSHRVGQNESFIRQAENAISAAQGGKS